MSSHVMDRESISVPLNCMKGSSVIADSILGLRYVDKQACLLEMVGIKVSVFLFLI